MRNDGRRSTRTMLLRGARTSVLTSFLFLMPHGMGLFLEPHLVGASDGVGKA
jgi:hypothetical protein